MKRRFECIMDPCDRHMVWDNENDIPVMFGAEMLAFTIPSSAERAAAVLNAAEADPIAVAPHSIAWPPSDRR